MVERKVVLHYPAGIHLRPAGNICHKALEYKSSIQIRIGSKEINAKSLLGILSACMRDMDEITVVCDGADEAEALEAMVSYIESGLPDHP